MNGERSRWILARRSFLAKLGAGATALGAAFGADVLPAQAQSASTEKGRWQPARHTEDDWLDQVPAQHRFFFDTTTPAAVGEALLFANNYFTATKAGYGASNGLTLDALIKRGVRFAVCQSSTRGYATVIAQATGGRADDIYKELTEHLIPNASLVPAGIVAVNHAQEHG